MSPRTTAPARRRARSFRLGEAEERPPVWRRYGAVVVALIVVAAVFGIGGYLVGSPSETEQMASDIRASDAARDQKQIVELTDLARATRDELAPVLKGMASAPTAASVAEWQGIVAGAAKKFDDPPSGSTATNVARGGFTAAVDQLAAAVTSYQLSLAQPALKSVADQQRDLAVRTWSVGATQLDQVNVDAGHGHQHVYLEADPESEAFTPDGEPEGHGK